MGWRRTVFYYGHRVRRLPATTYAIAVGLANGASVSFTPIPGTHIVQALILSAATKANMLASVLGTFLGNPWTFPLIWWASYVTGEKIFRYFGWEQIAPLPEHFTLAELWAELTLHPMGLLVPWIAGGYVLTVLSWPIFYLIFYALVLHIRSPHRAFNRAGRA